MRWECSMRLKTEKFKTVPFKGLKLGQIHGKERTKIYNTHKKEKMRMNANKTTWKS